MYIFLEVKVIISLYFNLSAG